MDRQIEVPEDGWMDRQMEVPEDGRMDGQIEVPEDGWMDTEAKVLERTASSCLWSLQRGCFSWLCEVGGLLETVKKVCQMEPRQYLEGASQDCLDSLYSLISFSVTEKDGCSMR